MWICKLCGESYLKETPAFGHKIIIDKAIEPTCTQNGKTEGSHCQVCGEILQAQKIIPALGHQWDEGKTITKATCTRNGKKLYTCTRNGCKSQREQIIRATGHTIRRTAAVAPTCTRKGLTAGRSCSICDIILASQKTVNALGHKWDTGKITERATCTQNGKKIYHCTRNGCTAQKTTIIKAKGHTVVKDRAVAATCTRIGKTEGSHCSVCRKILTPQKIQRAFGHSWGKWIPKKGAVSSKTEIKRRVCSRCKKTETRIMKKIR